jgi:serine/threonine-protein kinase RsbW
MIKCIEIRSAFREVRKVSTVARKNSETLGFNTTEVYEIELSVVEAVTNCIKHAYNGENESTIKVEFEIEQDALKILVIDSGKCWESFEAARSKPSPFSFEYEKYEDAPENGMGLAIIDQVMDDISYHRKENHNILSLSKKLPENR